VVSGLSAVPLSGLLSFQLKPKQPVHFVGVGGIGMSALARLLLSAGHPVSGSDSGLAHKPNAQADWLKQNGATIYDTHAASNVPKEAVVVLSTAIASDNPERLIAAQRAQVTIHRSELLREILHGKALSHQAVVGVSGTHGKTTMTGMLGHVLLTANMDPTIVAGGILPSIGTNARWGSKRQIAVAELDESDGSIVQYTPTHLIIANLEMDHADHYPGGFAQILRTFEQVLAKMPVGALVAYNKDCPATANLVQVAGRHLKQIAVSVKDPTADVYGHQPVPHGVQGYQAKLFLNHQLGQQVGQQIEQQVAQQAVGNLVISVPGLHNIYNALMAAAVAHKLGVPLADILQGLQTFSGMGRRFEHVAEPAGVLLVDDYGHHPTEVQATLTAAKELATQRGGQLAVVFQPHRYSRLQSLWQEFTQAFTCADTIYITDVYAAGEAPLPDIDAQHLSVAVGGSYVPKSHWASLSQTLVTQAKPGDILVSMGAGDITQLWRQHP
jgi:UDP-N-acetylmuramate--alanine ligase